MTTGKRARRDWARNKTSYVIMTPQVTPVVVHPPRKIVPKSFRVVMRSERGDTHNKVVIYNSDSIERVRAMRDKLIGSWPARYWIENEAGERIE